MNINFKRGINPKESLGIGITAFMWFGPDKSILEGGNDGHRQMWISKSFIDKLEKEGIIREIYPRRFIFNDNNFYGVWKSGGIKYRLDFFIHLAQNSNKGFIGGRSGDSGFNSGQTKRNTLGKRTRKILYDQVWKYLGDKIR